MRRVRDASTAWCESTTRQQSRTVATERDDRAPAADGSTAYKQRAALAHSQHVAADRDLDIAAIRRRDDIDKFPAAAIAEQHLVDVAELAK